MLKAAGVTSVKLDENLPFLGTLLKKEQDLVALRRSARGRRALALVSVRRADVRRLPLRAAAAQGAGRRAGGGRARAGAERSACTRARSTASTTWRARCCVHSEAHLDAFDQAFLAALQGRRGRARSSSPRSCSSGSKDAKQRSRELTAEERELLEQLDLEKLKQLFEERLREQKERHDGGNSGSAPAARRRSATRAQPREGIRVGGAGGSRSARCRSPTRARTAPYRDDVVLDMRQMEVALRKLRAFAREGADDELDLDGTIDATAKNAGELEVVMRPPRRPNTRVILMMDVGGSMDPYARADVAAVQRRPSRPRTSRSCAPTTSTTASTAASTRPSASTSRSGCTTCCTSAARTTS